MIESSITIESRELGLIYFSFISFIYTHVKDWPQVTNYKKKHISPNRMYVFYIIFSLLIYAN